MRAKLIATLSAELGTRHSMTNLEEEVFYIVERIPYVTKKLSVGVSYCCMGVTTGDTKVFDEVSIVPTNPSVPSTDRHAPFEK